MEGFKRLENVSPWIVAHNMQSNKADFYGDYTLDGVNYGMKEIRVLFEDMDGEMKFNDQLEFYEFDIQRLIVECKYGSIHVKEGVELDYPVDPENAS